MNFKPIQKLSITRILSTAQAVPVGVLAQNRQGVFFQYDADYLSRFGNLAPFTLPPSLELHMAPKQPHDGLHGVFGDSLPDGWGRLLQDRVFRQHGIQPNQVTAMDRLAFVGQSGTGALAYAPASTFQPQQAETLDIATMGLHAQAIYDGQTQDVFDALVAAGSSGGARPKATLFFDPQQPNTCRTQPQAGDEAWLVKFTSKNLPLGHEEGLCEAVYLHLAQAAELQPPTWRLIQAPQQSGAVAWLAIKRFDWTPQGGRRHQISASGLLDADFRLPSLDYETLIKATSQLCRSPVAGQLQYKRAIFNLFACNQDDHSKNWAFLQQDDGQWQPAPFFDVTHSPGAFNEHATAFGGYGKQPPLNTMQALADRAGFASWKHAQKQVQQIVDVIATFPHIAKQQGVKQQTIDAIETRLAACRKDNRALLSV